MRILATSDLHGRRDWFDFLLRKARNFDAIAIAGDLVDQDSDPVLQIAFLRQWVEAVHKAGIMLFLAEGNHEVALQPQWPRHEPPSDWARFVERAQIEETWMHALTNDGAEVVPGMTKLVTGNDQLLVTSLRYARENDSANQTRLEAAAQVRRANRSRWLVLYHQPPSGVLGHPAVSSAALSDWIECFAPDIVVVGHDHEAPFRSGTCMEMIGLTRVINAGQSFRRKQPTYVELDTASMRFLWRR